MKTIALRFGEQFSPKCGTIAAHQEIINKIGYVWWGKLGLPINTKLTKELESQDNLKILLINSGKTSRFWAYVSNISRNKPSIGEYPSYYNEKVDSMKTWLKITSFEKAPNDVMSKCFLVSSDNTLTETSKYSMSPYFIITYNEN